MSQENDGSAFRYAEREAPGADASRDATSASGRADVDPAESVGSGRGSGAATGTDSQPRPGSGDSPPLLEDERVLVDARPTWWAWTTHLVVAALLALSGLAFGGEAVIGGAVLGLTIVVYVAARRSRIRYLVTDRRIVVISGFSARKTNETWMEDVRGLQTRTTAFSRRQGYGTITISHAVLPQGFSRVTGLRLPGVPNHEAVADAIRRRQSERKAGNYRHS